MGRGWGGRGELMKISSGLVLSGLGRQKTLRGWWRLMELARMRARPAAQNPEWF